TTVDSILDAIRHEKLSVVGILATDERDVLFLAREVKRAAPNVQLFLFGTHALYLHPAYVPYLRGALVASSYALTLANQPEIKGTSDPLHREPFPSMSAEGVFYAMRALKSVPVPKPYAEYSLPYCRQGVETNCVPVAPVSISVIGEDGYWTLPTPAKESHQTADAKTSPDQAPQYIEVNVDHVPQPTEVNVPPLPGVPLRFGIGALLVLVIVAGHLYLMLRIRRVMNDPAADKSFLEWPVVR